MTGERFYPLGCPVRVSTRSAEALQAIQESWSEWAEMFPRKPIQLSVEVFPGTEPPRKMLCFTADPGGIAFHYGGLNQAVYTAHDQRIHVQLSDRLVKDRDWFRHQLDTLILTVLDFDFFTPIHGACVSRNGRGVILCGDSGAGKSTLSYACARSGWTLVSDDAIHVLQDRLAGYSQTVYLRPPTRNLFPELASKPTCVAPNGKEAILVQPERKAQVAEFDRTVFLSRRPGAADLKPLQYEEAARYFRKYLWHHDPSPHERKLQQLMAGHSFRLEYERVEDAVAALE